MLFKEFRLRLTFSVLTSLGISIHAQSVDLKGRVLEKAGMLPVAGATVKITGSSLTALSDAEGRFVLKGNTAGLGSRSNLIPETAYLQGTDLFINAANKGQSALLELSDLSGQNLLTSNFNASHLGWNQLSVQSWPSQDFFGLAKITTGGVTSVQRVLHLSGQLHASRVSASTLPSRALVKSAAGQVDVSMDKLVAKSVPYTADVADLGDIVLDYPERAKIGVGATTPYGAKVLFDGTGTEAQALKQMTDNWEHWLGPVRFAAKLGVTPILFKIQPDPVSAGKWTMMTCCKAHDGSPGWGHDDLIAKPEYAYQDYQLHVEFNMLGTYDDNLADGYSNSGVYIDSRYEVQIKTIQNPITDNHEIASLVDDKAPTKRATFKNGDWQAYDITFRGPRWTAGTVTPPAPTGTDLNAIRTSQVNVYTQKQTPLENPYTTIWWNGEMVHNNVQPNGKAAGGDSGPQVNSAKFPFKLQSEGTDIRYRNVWIKPLAITQPQTNFGY